MGALGVDIGTTGCKAVLFDDKFQIVAVAHQTYKLYIPSPECKELDVEEVKSAIFNCIYQCCNGGRGEMVEAISFSAQGEAVVAIDQNGYVLGKAMVSFDTRDINEVEQISSTMDMEQMVSQTGVPLHTMFTLPKILWMKKHTPDIYYKTWKFMCFADYLAYTLGAPPVMDYSLASRTMIFDVTHKKWNENILKTFGLDVDKFPQLAPSGTQIGTVSEEMGLKVGLVPGTAIVTGGHDQVCCGLGSGVLSDGKAMNSMGTTDTLLCVSSVFYSGTQQLKFNIPCGCYYDGELFANHSFVLTTGSVINWFRYHFFGKKIPSFLELEKLLKEKLEPTGMIFLPHFSGAGTPTLNSHAKGAWIGMGLETDIVDLYKAILEGNSYECKLNMENMENAGISINSIRCIGGASVSEEYLQIKADIYGKIVEQVEIEEAGCVGAALMAMHGIGKIQYYEKFLEDKIKIKKIFKPREEISQKYQELYKKYKEFHQLMDGFYKN